MAKKKPDAEAVRFNPIANIDCILDDIEKDYGLSGTSLDASEMCTTTSLLCLDMILGGGIRPGWYTFLGGEQSCKSTLANTIMASVLAPVVAMFDYEGSTSAAYIENIQRTNGQPLSVDELFGVRDQKSQKWIIRPRVRYYAEGVAEKFFDFLAKLERKLPDKVRMGDSWFYVYENSKDNKSLVGSNYDQSYFKKTGKLRVPASDGSLQAVLVLDSLPAMLPERLDVDDPGSGMAAQARMFSEQLKRVKGKMKAKRIAVLAVNQLRKAPAVMFGNPEYEPCGEAVRFYSDVRLRMQPRVMNAAPGNATVGKGSIEEEESLCGGTDTYRYIHVRAIKNKLSNPNMETWVRLWITDSDNQARGLDPVWDTWRYLVDTGQASGKRNAVKIAFGSHVSKSMKWLQFKALIVGGKKLRKETCAAVGLKAIDLRALCRAQLANGEGQLKYFEAKKLAVAEKASKTKDVSSSDDPE